MDFVDREKELAFLEDRWKEGGAQFIVLWGRRRVGKTELVKQFVAGKPHVYFLAGNTVESDQLRGFSAAVGALFKEPLLETRGFAAWEESFRYLRDKRARLALVVDEFPYLVGANPGIPALFQLAWDEYWRKSGVFLVLLGSSVAMMENEVLGRSSPLFGRRTGQWKVAPMTFAAASGFRPGKPFDDRMAHYSLAGGIPAYWLQLSRSAGFYENLESRVLRKGQMLYDEVEFLVRAELREPRTYLSLLQAVASGKRRVSEIANAAGLPQPTANKYLGVLSDLEIVERELPVTEDKPLKSKKGLYRIRDEFLRFWLRFVLPRRSELEMGRQDVVIAEVKRELPGFISPIYEKVAAETVLHHAGDFFPISRIGRWWDKGSEIDLVALDQGSDSILFGEAKWSNKRVGEDVLDALKAKAALVAWGRKGRTERFCLFSRSGFTPALISRARREKVALFRGDRLI